MFLFYQRCGKGGKRSQRNLQRVTLKEQQNIQMPSPPNGGSTETSTALNLTRNFQPLPHEVHEKPSNNLSICSPWC